MTNTKQQDVVNAKNKLAELKTAYVLAVRSYIVQGSNNITHGLAELLDCQQTANSYFNYAEEFVGNSDLLGAHESSLWAQGFAEDCAEILKSMPAHFQLLKDGFSKANSSLVSEVLPSGSAYANMQRMVVKYLTSQDSSSIKKLFIASKLPVYGFSNQARDFMSKKLKIILSFIFGVVFVVVMLAISFVQPIPSSFQYGVFRTVLALAGAGVVAVMPGFIEVKFGSWLRAGGALGVFVVLYFFNPALPEPNKQLDVPLSASPNIK